MIGDQVATRCRYHVNRDSRRPEGQLEPPHSRGMVGADPRARRPSGKPQCRVVSPVSAEQNRLTTLHPSRRGVFHAGVSPCEDPCKVHRALRNVPDCYSPMSAATIVSVFQVIIAM